MPTTSTTSSWNFTKTASPPTKGPCTTTTAQPCPCDEISPTPLLPDDRTCFKPWIEQNSGFTKYCFVVEIGYNHPLACTNSTDNKWEELDIRNLLVGVILNQTTVLTVTGNGVLRDPNTRKARSGLAAKFRYGRNQYKQIKVNKLFFMTKILSPQTDAKIAVLRFSNWRIQSSQTESLRGKSSLYEGKCWLAGRNIGDKRLTNDRITSVSRDQFEIPENTVWDLKSCIEKHVQNKTPAHPRYMHGPSLHGFCAGHMRLLESEISEDCAWHAGAPLVCQDPGQERRLAGLQVDSGCGENRDYEAIVEDVINIPTLKWIQAVTGGKASGIPAKHLSKN